MYWEREKTVYDPCPAGYHLPSADILKYLSTKGVKREELNAWEYDFDGRKLYYQTLVSYGEVAVCLAP